jgi:hypothetical protein
MKFLSVATLYQIEFEYIHLVEIPELDGPSSPTFQALGCLTVPH